MRTIRLHDTRTGAVQELEPRDPGRIGIYACGPTVYGRIHVGNARPYVVFSLLKRFLVHEGYVVDFVANVTDINDKIYAAAQERGMGSAELAVEMTDAYRADTDALELGRPDDEPLASETISEIVGLIDRLVERGHAYVADGDVLFSVRSFPDYGALSHRNIDDMDQGEGVEGADRKRDPLDFALWKATKAGEDTSWESPWGPGRPGWHIECSAMAERWLGLDFDIHGGGIDLVFPHHENEAAQTAAAHEVPLARVWMHNGMVVLRRRPADEAEKMSKSVGNIFLLHEALDRHGRDALVIYFVSGHYRQPIEFDDERLEQAEAGVRRIREAARRLTPGPAPEWSGPLVERFFAALADDFNTPAALAAVFDWVREANRSEAGTGSDGLREMLDVLGLANLLEADLSGAAPAAVRELAEARERARAERDFAAADRLREEIGAAGWEVRDSPAGAGGFDLLPVG